MCDTIQEGTTWAKEGKIDYRLTTGKNEEVDPWHVFAIKLKG